MFQIKIISEYEIENTSRSVGTEPTRITFIKFKNEKLNDETINVKLKQFSWPIFRSVF